ncbi:thioesterase II family protein [Streptomyces sp. NPDC059828]|uniref:thioesterase II family protein n=1 Tax=Streptomyces sp. NPDC059828 TaxID=3346965 RepID=UPI00364810F3
MTPLRRRTPVLRTFHAAPDAASRLVCFPHAGGSAPYYFPLSLALSPAVEVFGMQYPGRMDRSDEPAAEDIATLADEAATLIAAAPQPPPALFGHSMGALVAFETARRLEQQHGITPSVLIVSGMRSPSQPRRSQDWDREEVLLDELRLLAGTHPGLLENEELRELFLPVLRSDFRAVSTYPGDTTTVLSCPITAFSGDEDPVTPDGMEHWAAHTSAPFTSRSFPGDHFYLTGFPAPVVDGIRAALARR